MGCVGGCRWVGLVLRGGERSEEGRWSCREGVRGRWWEAQEVGWLEEKTSASLDSPSVSLCEHKSFRTSTSS